MLADLVMSWSSTPQSRSLETAAVDAFPNVQQCQSTEVIVYYTSISEVHRI